MVKHVLAAMAVALSVQAHAEEGAYPTNECIDSLGFELRLMPIADKVALSRSDQTAGEMLELDRAAQPAEQHALELWSKLRQACFDLGAEFRKGLPNAEQAALAGRLFTLHQNMIGELREGRITYAEFNHRRIETYGIATMLEAQMLERTEQTTAAKHEI